MAPPRPPFLDGLAASLPVAAGCGPIACSFAVAATQAGFTAAEAFVLSLIIYAGASQVLAQALLTSGAPVPVSAVALTAMHLRHVPYGPGPKRAAGSGMSARRAWVRAPMPPGLRARRWGPGPGRGLGRLARAAGGPGVHAAGAVSGAGFVDPVAPGAAGDRDREHPDRDAVRRRDGGDAATSPDLRAVAPLAGAAPWALRVLPTLARTDRLPPGGRVERFLAATGPAASATLFVAASLPALTPDLRAALPVAAGVLAVPAVWALG